MELTYTSLEQLRHKAEMALRAQRGESYDPTELDSETYRKWIEDAAERHRARGLLVTEQQRKDLLRGGLHAGDRVRYIGPTTIESVDGAHVPRPTGQLGEIVAVDMTSQGPVYTFVPRVAATAADTDTRIVRLVTRNWRLFERVQ